MTTEPTRLHPAVIGNLCLYSLMGGYADASGYLLSRSFTGHLTGNLVLFVVAITTHDASAVLRTAAAVIAFLAATTIGQQLIERSQAKLNTRSILVTGVVQFLLVAAAPLFMLHGGDFAKDAMIVCLASALGLQNGLFNSADGVKVHTTYLTGTITSLLKSVVASRSRTQDLSELQHSIRIDLSVWACFMLGAFAAAMLVQRRGASALFLLEIPILLGGIFRIVQRRQQAG